ncbi:TPA: septum formation inhibitor Maf [Candidatus Poribacteria bacterium]|nr:septum formation inhibitor Maf [Candidatus Poribacteria bacterium]
MPKRIILASASARRKQLLEQVGLIFDIIPSNVDENDIIHNDPLKNAQAIALYKAQNVAIKVKEGIVIGADTQILVNGEVLGKPIDKRDAINMLSKLSGKTHQVITGVAIIDTQRGIKETWAETTLVKFRELSIDEIIAYVESGEYEGKAGAYGIQGRAAAFVEKIEGCYFNVVGLPLSRLMQRLRLLCK